MTSNTLTPPINLTANDLAIGAPVLGTPTLTQNHLASATLDGAGGLRIVEEEIYIIPAQRNASSPPAPPKSAEFFLVLFAKSKRNEAEAGDLCEMYVREYAQLGSSRARLRFWARTVRFVLPLLMRELGRGVIEAVRRYLIG